MTADERNQVQEVLKKSLIELRTLRAKLARFEAQAREPIAIIGMACRFPGGVNSPTDYWELLANGRDAVSRVPADRWNLDDYYDPDPDAVGKMYTQCAGFLDQVDLFDAQFFGISPREAASLDPQQRLLLEVGWEAIDDAGIDAKQLEGSATGTFVGISSNDFLQLLLKQAATSDDPGYALTGTTPNLAAGRLAFVLGLQGPNVSLDTACSSALVATHLAVQSLRTRESDLALAAGVNVILSPDPSVCFSRLKALARDGRCKTFDAAADGYGRGEGCGVLVLKRLSDALRDGDRVHAVIRGSAINHDGRSSGLTVPNGLAQRAVLQGALDNAGVEAADVGYVEAHGTGTPLGDPIEVAAIGHVYGRRRAGPLYIGSVKTNFGHLEAAAGMAGLMKAVLMTQRKAIPPHLHLRDVNPKIALDAIPARVPRELSPWVSEGPKLAGVSAFSFSGSNAHVVIGEAPSADADEAPSAASAGAPPRLLPLSARSEAALRDVARATQRHLAHPGAGSDWARICYTHARRRTHHNHRLCVTASSGEAAAALLGAYLDGVPPRDLSHGVRRADKVSGLVFVFSGQGSQWAGMGRVLLESSAPFRAAIERVDQAYKRLSGLSVLEALAAAEGASRLGETAVAQPAIFALQVGVVELLATWAVVPQAVVGHSIGEVSAAYVAGALTLEQACEVVFHRAELMQRATGRGRMLSVELAADAAEELVARSGERLAVAAHNGPNATVIAGEPAAIEALRADLAARGARFKVLEVDYAFHSPQMEPFRPELVARLGAVGTRPGELPFYSTVTGGRLGGELDAAYWGRNMREPVRFAPAVAALLDDGYRRFLEVAPHPVLGGALAACLERQGHEGAVIATLRRERHELGSMLNAAGHLHCLGYPIDWSAIAPGKLAPVDLPAYPWRRRRYWALAAPRPAETGPDPSHELLGRRQPAPTAGDGIAFESILRPDAPAFLADHVMHGMVLVPATAFFEMGRRAAVAGLGAAAPRLIDVSIREPLALEEEGRVVRTVIDKGDDGALRLRIVSRAREGEGDDPPWAVHLEARVVAEHAGDPAAPSGPGAPDAAFDAASVMQRCHPPIDGAAFYRRGESSGGQLGAAFHVLRQIWSGDREALAWVELPEGLAGEAARYPIHPVVLDAGFQMLFAALPDLESGRAVYLPIALEQVRLPTAMASGVWAHFRLDDPGGARPESLRAEARFFDHAGHEVARLSGIHYRRTEVAALQQMTRRHMRQWLFDVQWRPVDAAVPGASNGPAGAQRWLLVGAEPSSVAALGAALQRAGAAVTLALAEASDTAADADDAVLEPEAGRLVVKGASRTAFARLLARARGADASPLHVALVAPRGGRGAPDDPRVPERAHGFARLALSLTQALLDGPPSPLWMVTRGAVASADGAVDPSGALAWGLGRVAQNEAPQLDVRLVDIRDGSEGGDIALARLFTHPLDENQIVVDGARLEVARLSRRPGAASYRGELHLSAEASYLITGGLGSIGLHLATFLASRGARHLALLGRHRPSPRALDAIGKLRAAGVQILDLQADVADSRALEAGLAEIQATLPPLRGVFHAAGVLEDGLLTNQDWDQFERVLSPKVRGGWNLHRLTAGIDLDHFVLFSSAAAILGAPGQASYAAANAFLGSLGAARRNMGLPALVVDWGPWAQTTMVDASGKQGARRREAQGMGTMTADLALEILESLLAGGASARTQICVAPLHVESLAKRVSGQFPPLLRALLEGARSERADGDAAGAGLGAALRELPRGEARERLAGHLRGHVAAVLGLDPHEPFDLRTPFAELGMDSLMAVEIKDSLKRALGLSLPATLMFEYPSGAELLEYLTVELLGLDVAKAVPPPDAAASLAREIDDMDEDDVDELLALLGGRNAELREEQDP